MTGIKILEANFQLALQSEPMSEPERVKLRQRMVSMRNHLPYLAAHYRDGQIV
jgi:hypothetical protein